VLWSTGRRRTHDAYGNDASFGLSTVAGVITGAHAIIFANAPEKVRAFFGDVLELPSVDAGGG
jgi:hypothetical protein